jgi:ankyrin repeat protein
VPQLLGKWIGATASSLECAAKVSNLEVVRMLARGFNSQDSESAALHFAAENGHFGIVKGLHKDEPKFLLEVRDNDGQTPLHRAATQGHMSIVSYLKEDRALRDATDEKGLRPFRVGIAAR